MRKAIWKNIYLANLQRQIKASQADNLRVAVGADGTHYDGWIHTDINTHNILSDSEWSRLFRPGSLRNVLAEHVWEHLTQAEGELAIRLAYKYLRPGGRLRIAVPDGNHSDPYYIEQVKVGGSGAGADDHKILYNQHTLSEAMRKVGFQVTLLEYFDEKGKFHSAEWDHAEGMIGRSLTNDERNADGNPHYTSLIVDGLK
jgi:predicted SAM-dependent methyltransferase